MSDSTPRAALRETLAETLGEAPWSMLEAHAKRDGIILVDPTLDLLDVAVAIAEDDGDAVSGWMEDGRLTKPDAQAMRTLEARADRQWPFVIVQPFVLVSGPERAH